MLLVSRAENHMAGVVSVAHPRDHITIRISKIVSSCDDSATNAAEVEVQSVLGWSGPQESIGEGCLGLGLQGEVGVARW